jgi:hypothetical protein
VKRYENQPAQDRYSGGRQKDFSNIPHINP